MPTLTLLRRQLDRLQVAVVLRGNGMTAADVLRDAHGRFLGRIGGDRLVKEAYVHALRDHITKVDYAARSASYEHGAKAGKAVKASAIWGEHAGLPAIKAHLAAEEAALNEQMRHMTPEEAQRLVAMHQILTQRRWDDAIPIPDRQKLDPATRIIQEHLQRYSRQQARLFKETGQTGKPPKALLTDKAGKAALARLSPEDRTHLTQELSHHLDALRAEREAQQAALAAKAAEDARSLHEANLKSMRVQNAPDGPKLSRKTAGEIMRTMQYVPDDLRYERREFWEATVNGRHYFIKPEGGAEVAQAVHAITEHLGFPDHTPPAWGISYGGKHYIIEPFMAGTRMDRVKNPKKTILSPSFLSPVERAKYGLLHYTLGADDVGDNNMLVSPSGKPVLIDTDSLILNDHQTTPVLLNALLGTGLGDDLSDRTRNRVAKMAIPPESIQWLRDTVLRDRGWIEQRVAQAAEHYVHDKHPGNRSYGQSLIAATRARLDVLTRLAEKTNPTWGDLEAFARDPALRRQVLKEMNHGIPVDWQERRVVTLTLERRGMDHGGRFAHLYAKRATLPDLRRRLDALLTRDAHGNQARDYHGRFVAIGESEAKHPSLNGEKIGGEGYRAHREASRLKDALSGLKARMDALHAQGNHAAAEHVQREATWRGHKGYAAITQHYAALQRTADREAGKLGGDAHTRTALATLMQEYRARLAGAGLSDADRARLTEEVHLIAEYGRKRGGVSLETSPSPQSFRLLSKAERASIREQVREAIGVRRVALPDLRLRLATLQRRAGGPLFDIHHHFAGWIGGGEALHEADLVKAHLAAHMAKGHPAPMETMWRGGKVNIFDLAKYETDLRAHAKRLAGTIHPGDEAQISHFAAQIREAANRAPDAATALEENARAAAHEAFLQLVREQRAGNGLGQYVTILSPHEIPPRTNRADVEGQVLPFSLDAFDLARATAQSITNNNVNVVTQTLIDGKPYIIKAVYGPAREPFTEAEQHHFEIMGIHLYQALGMSDLVPHAAYHVVGSDGRRYTVETVVRGITENFYREQQIMRDVSESDLQRHTLAEYVLGPRDRHMGNYIHDPTTHHLTSIDFNRGFYSIVGAAHPLQNSRPGALGLWQQQQAERQRTWKPLLRLSPHILSEVLSHRHTVVARAMALDPLTGQAIAARFDILAALWRNAGNGANADALTWDALLQLAGQRPD